MKFVSANRISLDGTPRFAASHQRLLCLHVSHKKDAMLMYRNVNVICYMYMKQRPIQTPI